MISEKLLIYLPQIKDFEINVDSTVRSFMLLLAGAKAYIGRTTSWVQNIAATPFEMSQMIFLCTQGGEGLAIIQTHWLFS